MAAIDLNAQSTALMVMDYQNGILASLKPDQSQRVLQNVQKAINASRKAGIPIIYVVVRFREDYPEVCSRNALFCGVKGAGILKEGSPDAEICAQIKPRPEDIVITKKRIGAFTGSDLEVVLRSRGIHTLVLAGISTLGVVESTARCAVDMDYRVIVLEDCCSDPEAKAHQAAVKWVLPYITTVCSSQDFLKSV